MATSSITKNFVIESDEECEILIKAFNEPTPKRKKTHYYEEGKKKLVEYFGH